MLLSPGAAVFLAVILAGCVWLALVPPRGLTTNRLARGIAVGAAVALGVGLVLASRLAPQSLGYCSSAAGRGEFCAALDLAPDNEHA